MGLDPTRNALAHLVDRAGALSTGKRAQYAGIAIAYGLLEGAEAYGLWRRRRWGEYLTIVATSLLLIPEVDELAKRPTALKAAGLALNVLIVAYLVARVWRHARPGR